MEAKDLMVGDWVSLLGTQYYKVKEIKYEYRVYKIFLQETYSYALEDEIVPIPLTPEILEKNGWEKTPTGYVFYTDGKRYDNSLWYIFGSNTFVVNTAEFQIKFIHQLQHALKLCGIDKEIEL